MLASVVCSLSKYQAARCSRKMSCSSTVGSLGRPAFPARIAVHPPAAVGCVPDSDFGVAGHVTCGRKIASATIAESTDGVLLPWHTTPHLRRSCRLHLNNLPPFTRIAYPPPRHASTHFRPTCPRSAGFPSHGRPSLSSQSCQTLRNRASPNRTRRSTPNLPASPPTSIRDSCTNVSYRPSCLHRHPCV